MKLWLCSYEYDYEGDCHIAIVDSEEKAKELEKKYREALDKKGDDFTIQEMELNKIYNDGGIWPDVTDLQKQQNVSKVTGN